MPKIELIYDLDCPNVAATRATLMRAFSLAGLPAAWTEWERGGANAPEHVRQFGSPAILMDGRDIGGRPPNPAASCRLYRNADGVASGVPSVELIVQALQKVAGEAEAEEEACPPAPRRPRLALVPLAPAVLLAFAPKLACPACWPAYAGLLSAVGLGFLVRTEYLLPLTVAFLVFALASLAYRASTRRGYRPFLAGTLSATALALGKFAMNSDPVFYLGLAGLIGSSLWNSWPRQPSKPAACCPGAPGGPRVHPGASGN